MYYLIKDKIVDDRQQPLIFKEYRGRQYLGFIGDDNRYQILKQAKNVYDLIEKGDLIAFEYMDTKTIDIAKVVSIYKHRDGEADISTRGYVHNNDKIQAIYKPTAKGDYIKAWEREE